MAFNQEMKRKERDTLQENGWSRVEKVYYIKWNFTYINLPYNKHNTKSCDLFKKWRAVATTEAHILLLKHSEWVRARSCIWNYIPFTILSFMQTLYYCMSAFKFIFSSFFSHTHDERDREEERKKEEIYIVKEVEKCTISGCFLFSPMWFITKWKFLQRSLFKHNWQCSEHQLTLHL